MTKVKIRKWLYLGPKGDLSKCDNERSHNSSHYSICPGKIKGMCHMTSDHSKEFIKQSGQSYVMGLSQFINKAIKDKLIWIEVEMDKEEWEILYHKSGY